MNEPRGARLRTARVREVLEHRRDSLLVLSYLGLFTLAATAPDKLMALLYTCALIQVNNFLNLRELIPWHIPRRVIRHLAYFAPALTFGFDWHLSWIAFALAIPPVLAYQWTQRESLRLMLDPAVCAFQPPASLTDRTGTFLFFLLPGVSQEYLHRYVIMTMIAHAGASAWLVVTAVAVSTLTFVLEHLRGNGRHALPNRKNILLWTGTGLLFGTVVGLTHCVVAVMVAHMLLNLPAALRPLLGPGLAPSGPVRVENRPLQPSE